MNYTKLSQVAQKMCKQYGAKASIVKTETVYDKEAHDYIESSTYFDGFAVVSNYDESLVNGSTILLGDMNVTFTPTDPCEPVTGDKISISGKTYNIVNVRPTSPNGSDIILYELQVRA